MTKVRAVVPKVWKSRRFRILAVGLLLVVVALGLILPQVEKSGVNPVINSEWEGVYFALTTVTGVGYGDLVPVTVMGQALTLILETVGVVMFGSIVAMVAVELLRYQEDFYAKRILERLDQLEMKLVKIEKHVDFLVRK